VGAVGCMRLEIYQFLNKWIQFVSVKWSFKLCLLPPPFTAEFIKKTCDGCGSRNINNCREQSPFWLPHSHCADQEIPSLLWNLEVPTMLTRAHVWILSWARRFKSIHSHLLCLTSSWILKSKKLPKVFLSYQFKQSHRVW